jgi:ketosteroid isomerase-like protein
MPLDEKNAETMTRYYERTNVGDFLGALEFLSEDVVYSIPGPADRVPYSGEWRGKNQVMLCFEAFNAAFGLVDMAETRTVAGPDDLFSINDEIFVSRSTGRPWRVGVVHHMSFDGDHLIARLDNYTDMVAAVQALRGQSAISVPMLPPDLVPGEQDISADQARAVVASYYQAAPDVAGLLDENATALIPGDPRRLRFSGAWRGRAEFTQMTNYHAAALVLEEQVIEHLVAENGSVAAVTHLRGTFVPTSTPVDLRAVDFFQVTGEGKVGRLCRYFDSCLLTGA